MPGLTTQELYQQAMQHHQAGRLREAETLYRQVLSAEPQHVEAMGMLARLALQVGQIEPAIELLQRAIRQQPGNAAHVCNLGMVFATVGRFDEAVATFRQALSIQPNFPEAYSNLGNVYKTRRQLREAIAAYQQALALRPGFADAYNNLGSALRETGQLDGAIAAFEQAVAARPEYPEAHNNLGTALRERGRLDDAIAAHRRALSHRPDYADALLGLGSALLQNGQLDEAIAALRQAIARNPSLADAYFALGSALHQGGDIAGAVAAYQQCVQLRPDYAGAQNNLGLVLQAGGRLDEALAAIGRALRLRPDYAEAHNNMGIVLQNQRRTEEAIVAFRQALSIQPIYAEAFNNLGLALQDTGRTDDAIAAYRRSLELRRGYPEALNNLGNALRDSGRLDDALACLRQAVLFEPDAVMASNLLYALHFHPDDDPRTLREAHARWNQTYARPLASSSRPHENERLPERRLRIGYVSPDLGDHPVGRFLLPVLANHDRTGFEVACYTDLSRPDAMTDRLRSHTDRWINTMGLSDERLAEQIRADRVDVLVDLAMHAAGNRMLTFARKPAPVQVTYLAYCSTTGLETMDYRLTDQYIDPPGAEPYYTEQSFQLPGTYWCFAPPVQAPAAIGPLPALAAGHITFGCLNNYGKITPPIWDLWCQILAQMPNARLILHSREGSHRQEARDRLKGHGLDPARLEFVGILPLEQYFAQYDRIDVALDPFPYCGGTTTCDALWMGVPVVTLTGRTAISRAGASILSNVGLGELVADSTEKYASIASELARDVSRLSNLRDSMRARMQSSRLMDAPRFAREIESAYRQMWRNWCSGSKRSS